MRYKVIYKPFGSRCRKLKFAEIEADRPHEAFKKILKSYPLAELAGVFVIEGGK